MVQQTVDINCDLGEGKTLEDCNQDALLMPFISRCNIACGGHAGNPLTMLQTLMYAKKHQLKCGAHPGYPDQKNFGRVSMHLSLENLFTSLASQIDQLSNIAQQINQKIGHIKLHGALYNDAEKSDSLANALCQFFANHYKAYELVGLAGGAMQKHAQLHGLNFLREGFMDRAYLSSGQLAPRSLSGSVYQTEQQCIAQVLCILQAKALNTLDNDKLVLQVDTLCLHGDSQIAFSLAKQLHALLVAQGKTIK